VPRLLEVLDPFDEVRQARRRAVLERLVERVRLDRERLDRVARDLQRRVQSQREVREALLDTASDGDEGGARGKYDAQ